MGFGSGCSGFSVDEIPPLLNMVAAVRSFHYRVTISAASLTKYVGRSMSSEFGRGFLCAWTNRHSGGES